MQDSSYNIAENGNGILLNNNVQYYGYFYIIVGDYKIVTARYVRKSAYNVPSGKTNLAELQAIPSNFRYSDNLYYQTYNSNIRLIFNANGTIQVENTSSSTINNVNLVGSITYIVPNRQV